MLTQYGSMDLTYPAFERLLKKKSKLNNQKALRTLRSQSCQCLHLLPSHTERWQFAPDLAREGVLPG